MPVTVKSKSRWLLVLDGVLVMVLYIVLLMFVPEVFRRCPHEPGRPHGPIVGDKQEKASSGGLAIQDIDREAPLRARNWRLGSRNQTERYRFLVKYPCDTR
jgi:hypothetical protein